MVTISGVDVPDAAIIGVAAGVLVAISLCVVLCIAWCVCGPRSRRRAELRESGSSKDDPRRQQPQQQNNRDRQGQFAPGNGAGAGAAKQQQQLQRPAQQQLQRPAQQQQLMLQQQQQQLAAQRGPPGRVMPAKSAESGASGGSSDLSLSPLPPPPPPGLAGPGRPGQPGSVPAHQRGPSAGTSSRGTSSPGSAKKWEEDLQATLFRKMSLEEIRAATGYFNKHMFLGEGAFAVVFRGTGPSGVPWAVKRSKAALAEGSSGALDFEKEVIMISKLSHRNLVRLLGYCNEGGEHILVYEFAERGSLGSALSTNKPALSFSQRLDVAVGTAEALNYLHSAAAQPIVHRDVKPDNIFLDRNLKAKVGDFGLLKNLVEVSHEIVRSGEGGAGGGSGGRGEDEGSSLFKSAYTRIAGTPGYLDPDYHLTSKVTTKGDVYSFGVVLLQLCTGQRAILMKDPNQASDSRDAEGGGGAGPQLVAGVVPVRVSTDPIHISQWVAPYVEAKVVEPVADARFGNDYNKPALFRMLEIGLLCVRSSARKRPAMGTVVRWLHDVRDQMEMEERGQAGGEDGEEEEGEGHYSLKFSLEKLMEASDTDVDYLDRGMRFSGSEATGSAAGSLVSAGGGSAVAAAVVMGVGAGGTASGVSAGSAGMAGGSGFTEASTSSSAADMRQPLVYPPLSPPPIRPSPPTLPDSPLLSGTVPVEESRVESASDRNYESDISSVVSHTTGADAV